MNSKNQPTGYNFEVKGKLLKEHECPICLQLIRIATELPCSHLMCRDCLVYYENNSSKTEKDGLFPCCICKKAYRKKQKKKVKSIDRIIRESIDVKCKQSEEGCGWTGCISNYESHHINVCGFVLLKCGNDGCKECIQRRDKDNHQKVCQYSVVQCIYCEEVHLNFQTEDHLQTCPLRPLACPNDPCEEKIQQRNMKKHCDEDCQYQMVDCTFNVLGCDVKIERHALKDHLREENHLSLLMKSHLSLAKVTNDFEKHCEDRLEQQIISLTSLQDDLNWQKMASKSRVGHNRKMIEEIYKAVAKIICDLEDSSEKQSEFKAEMAEENSKTSNLCANALIRMCVMEGEISTLKIKIEKLNKENVDSRRRLEDNIRVSSENQRKFNEKIENRGDCHKIYIENLERKVKRLEKLNDEMTEENSKTLSLCANTLIKMRMVEAEISTVKSKIEKQNKENVDSRCRLEDNIRVSSENQRKFNEKIENRGDWHKIYIENLERKVKHLEQLNDENTSKITSLKRWFCFAMIILFFCFNPGYFWLILQSLFNWRKFH